MPSDIYVVVMLDQRRTHHNQQNSTATASSTLVLFTPDSVMAAYIHPMIEILLVRVVLVPVVSRGP